MRATPATFENAQSFARDLVRIPGLPGHEEAVARRVREEVEALGLTDVRVDDGGNVLGVVKGRGAALPILLNCNLDVVAEGHPSDWEFPPCGAEVGGGFPHGRGAMDIKGPLALQTHAAAALAGFAPGEERYEHTKRERLDLEEACWAFARYPGLVMAVQNVLAR